MTADFNFSIPFQIRNKERYRQSVFHNIDDHTKKVKEMLKQTFPELSITETVSLSDMFNIVSVYFGMNDTMRSNDEKIINSRSEEIFLGGSERYPEDVDWETDSLSQSFREAFQLIRANYEVESLYFSSPELPSIKTDGFLLNGMIQDVIIDQKGGEYTQPTRKKSKLRLR